MKNIKNNSYLFTYTELKKLLLEYAKFCSYRVREEEKKGRKKEDMSLRDMDNWTIEFLNDNSGPGEDTIFS